MDPCDLPIEQFLPHRGAMRLVDRLLHADEQGAEVEALIRPGSPFFRDGTVPAYVGIEFMAQAVAAWAGVRAWRKGETVRPGFLLGTRRYTCSLPVFRAGSTLRIGTRSELIDEGGFAVFACHIAVEGATVAEANLSVYQLKKEDLRR